jgi:SNF2 family DNA or RNA helicase
MDNYIVPYINITPNSVVPSMHNVDNIIGKIKDSINCNNLIESGKTLMNNDFVDFLEIVSKSTNNFITLSKDYYDENVKKHFDLYGCMYVENHVSIDFLIKIYFYKIKNIELLTKKTIEDFNLIFQYDYFNRNNILQMDWHSYRLTLFTKDVNKQKFMNLVYLQPTYCRSKLFNHQINNISQMLMIYNKPEEIPIMDIIMKFENGLIYDFVKRAFIEEDMIPKYKIQGGMILDEPGTGKTLQFILFLLELQKKSLVLVPNNSIKKVWTDEFKKHIEFDIHLSSIEIMTVEDLEAFISLDNTILDNFEIIGIDEIHILYSKNIKLFQQIITSNIKSRWGITGTPFVNENSLFNVIKFLTGHNFKNERIANIPSLQDKLIKLFLKNLKINMQEDYAWPELTITDIFVELDIVQRKLYETELNTTHNKTNLRKIISEVQLMFEGNNITTPADLKIYGMTHYKKLYEAELSKFELMNLEFENIIKKKDTFKDQEEFIKRVEHYKKNIIIQKEIVARHKTGYTYFMTSIETISNIFENKEIDDWCAICLNKHTPPITYFKLCGHYFCSECIELMTIHTNNCPLCRKTTTKSDIIMVQDLTEINESPKLYEIYNILSKSSERFIIFSQFNILDKFYTQLNKKKINTMTYEEYFTNSTTHANHGECKVLLLSSDKNAEGIDLSMFDKLIIFEPFEDHMYCKEIEKQLIARIHRIGRIKKVDVFRLITKDTIEEEIYSSLII